MSVLDDIMSPSDAITKLSTSGIQISERTLRDVARRLGACRVIGKAMFFMPSDIELIINAARVEPRECQKSTSAREATTGNIPLRLTGRELETLRTRLIEGSRKTSQSRKKQPTVVPLSMAQKQS